MMFTNSLIIARRNLWAPKRDALSNVLGLGVGMACCVMATLVMHREMSYDRFHPKAERVYRVLRERVSNEQTQVRWLTSGALARTLESEIPELNGRPKTASPRLWRAMGNAP